MAKTIEGEEGGDGVTTRQNGLEDGLDDVERRSGSRGRSRTNRSTMTNMKDRRRLADGTKGGI